MKTRHRSWYLLPFTLLGLAAFLAVSSWAPPTEAAGGWCWGAQECLDEEQVCLATCDGLPPTEFVVCKGDCHREARICNMQACGAPI